MLSFYNGVYIAAQKAEYENMPVENATAQNYYMLLEKGKTSTERSGKVYYSEVLRTIKISMGMKCK